MSLLSVFISAAAVLLFAGGGYRLIAWSIDSPILRRAMRRQPFDRPTQLGFALVIAATAAIIWRLEGSPFSGAGVVFGSMTAIFGCAAVLFFGLVVEEVRDIYRFVARGSPGASHDFARALRRLEADSEARCRAAPTCCSAAPHNCGPRFTTHPRRPAIPTRSPQHHG